MLVVVTSQEGVESIRVYGFNSLPLLRGRARVGVKCQKLSHAYIRVTTPILTFSLPEFTILVPSHCKGKE